MLQPCLSPPEDTHAVPPTLAWCTQSAEETAAGAQVYASKSSTQAVQESWLPLRATQIDKGSDSRSIKISLTGIVYAFVAQGPQLEKIKKIRAKRGGKIKQEMKPDVIGLALERQS
ncbi:hypothetical protein J437_LFUL016926 [Ladona fulva]|uniref:Uncharacterized protein n=1 Tax=Ladona fulva TaxID=123851 RepID=A0A8K0KQA8_LADFU|nr:hypothetical protein J437_LFUL016926 [Ladona fulva]